MKLGFFISSMDSGGAERVMAILINNFVRNGHEVHLFVYSGKDSFYKLDSRIKIHRLGRTQSGLGKAGLLIAHLRSAKKAKRLIREYKLDCIVGFVTFINCITILIGKYAKVPVIISERADPVQYKVRSAADFMRKRVYKYANSIVLQTSRSIQSFVDLKIELPDNQRVILNPIDPTFKDIGEQRDKVVMSVGRLSFEKGHDLLLRAFANIKMKDWKLHIIGEGVEKGKLVDLAKELNIDDSVTWLGRKNNISDFLNKCSVYVLPSRTEGFPNALAEAMACGCAVVSFDCPNGPSELITDGENGLLVEAGYLEGLTAAMNKLIADEGLRKKIGAAAEEIRERLDQNLIFLEWEAHFANVIAKTKTS